MLKPEQLQAVRHIYEGSCHEVLPFLLDCKFEMSESSIVIIASPLVSPMVDQVASLRLHDLQIWLGKSPRIRAH